VSKDKPRSSSPIDVNWEMLPYNWAEPPAGIPLQLDFFVKPITLGFLLWCSGLVGCTDFQVVKKDGTVSACVLTDPSKSKSCEAPDPPRAP
jgi:hypothetical protein